MQEILNDTQYEVFSQADVGQPVELDHIRMLVLPKNTVWFDLLLFQVRQHGGYSINLYIM